MAGVRQHILPRFLLKGFASKMDGQEVFTWVCRKGGNVFEANIKNVAVEKHFYTGTGEINVDDEITEIERGFALLLDELRQMNHGFEVTNPGLPEFVVHLSSRTKHLRDSFIDMTGAMTSILSDYLADERNVRAWLLDYYKRHPEVVRKSIDDAILKMQLPRYQRRAFRQRLQNMISAERLMTQLDGDIPQYALMFSVLGPTLLQSLPAIVKDGHIQALAKSLVAEPRVEKYQQLNWFVCKPNEPLILGDVGCLFDIVGEDKLRSLGGTNEIIRMAYLPIASNCLLVGSAADSIPELDCKAINKSFASYSRDFFVCRHLSEETEELLAFLGKDSQILSDSELELMIREVISEGGGGGGCDECRWNYMLPSTRFRVRIPVAPTSVGP